MTKRTASGPLKVRASSSASLITTAGGTSDRSSNSYTASLQHETVDDGEPLEPPVRGRLGNQRVDAIEDARGALGEFHGQRVALGHRRAQLQVAHAGNGLGQRVAAQLPAVEHLQGALARLAQVLRVSRHPSLPCTASRGCQARANLAIVTTATAAS